MAAAYENLLQQLNNNQKSIQWWNISIVVLLLLLLVCIFGVIKWFSKTGKVVESEIKYPDQEKLFQMNFEPIELNS